MSCYMQDREQTIKIAAYITEMMNTQLSGGCIMPMFMVLGEERRALMQEAFPKAYNAEAKRYDVGEVYKAMWEMNRDSVVARYGKDNYVWGDFFPLTDTMPDIDLSMDTRKKWIARLYKSICNYLYQSNEGDCMKRPLFKFLEGYADSLAHGLANLVCEEEGAEWGSWNEYRR